MSKKNDRSFPDYDDVEDYDGTLCCDDWIPMWSHPSSFCADGDSPEPCPLVAWSKVSSAVTTTYSPVYLSIFVC